MTVTEQLHRVHERLDALEQRMNHELATKDDLEAGLSNLGAELRRELATKDDLAELRDELGGEMAQLHQQSAEDRRRANLEPYGTVRQDMHELREEMPTERREDLRQLKHELTGEIVRPPGPASRILPPHAAANHPKPRTRVPGPRDGAWKNVLDALTDPFLALLFPAVHALIDWRVPPVLLETELQQIIGGGRGPQARRRPVDQAAAQGRRRLLAAAARRGPGKASPRPSEGAPSC